MVKSFIEKNLKKKMFSYWLVAVQAWRSWYYIFTVLEIILKNLLAQRNELSAQSMNVLLISITNAW